MINWLILTHLPKWTRRRGYGSEAIAFTSRRSSKRENFAGLSWSHLWLFHECQYRSRMSSWLRYWKGNQIPQVQCWLCRRFALTRMHLISLFFHSSSAKWQWKIVFYKYPWAGFLAAQIHTHDRFEAEGDLLKLSNSAIDERATLVKIWRHGDIS